jgi:hypothetical protein
MGLIRWDREAKFFVVVLLASVLLSLGDTTPIFGLAMRLVPGLSILRIPSRFFLLVPLAVSVLVGRGVQKLTVAESLAETGEWRRIRLAIVGLMAAYTLFHLGLSIISSGRSLIENPWATVSLALALVLVITGLVRGFQRRLPWLTKWLPIVLLFSELGILNRATVDLRSFQPIAEESIPTELRSDWGKSRVFSPDYSVTQDEASHLRLELIHGVTPLQLTSTWNYLAQALDFDPEGYSVTLPPYPQGDPELPPPLDYDLPALSKLNMEYVVSSIPVDVEGLETIGSWRGNLLLRNPSARPRAWIEPLAGSQLQPEWEPVEELVWTPNRITVRTSESGRLVLSEMMASGWSAIIDGRPAELDTAGIPLRSVVLSEGPHVIEFHYEPPEFYVGIALTVLFWLGLAALWKK